MNLHGNHAIHLYIGGKQVAGCFALLDAAVQEAANNKKKCDADHEPEAETEHDEEGGEDGEEEDVELDEPVPEEGS